MESRTITRINGVEISAIVENGETYLPIKPICQAIGVNYTTQLDKLKIHPILSSVIPLRGTTGADGKTYEMVCIPLKFVYGWLFTINPGNVSEEARDNVMKYQLECYEVLYNHFAGVSKKAQEENEAEIRLLEDIARLNEQASSLKTELKEKKESLSRLRASRLDPQPTLF